MTLSAGLLRREEREVELEQFKKYTSFVDQAASTYKGTSILCKNMYEADYLVGQLAKDTQRTMDVVVSNTPPTIERYLCEHMLDYCNHKDITLRVLFTQYKANNNHHINIPKRCENQSNFNDIRSCTAKSIQALHTDRTYKFGEVMTFFLFDDNKYMLQLRPNSYISSANFHNPERNAELKMAFNMAFKESPQI